MRPLRTIPQAASHSTGFGCATLQILNSFVAEVERVAQAQREAAQRSSKAEEQLAQACQAQAAAHKRHLQLEHTLTQQVCCCSACMGPQALSDLCHHNIQV